MNSPGHTRWRRFAGVLVPALAVVGLMMVGMLHGALPVSAAVQGQQRIKISVKHLSAQGYGTFPQFFRTHKGHTDTVVVVGLSKVRAQGVCASSRVDTPVGHYVLRIATKPNGPPLQAGDLKMAIQSVDGADIAGKTLSLNRASTAPDGTPQSSGPPGTLPINAHALVLNIHANLRWVTASNLSLQGLNLSVGPNVPECF